MELVGAEETGSLNHAHVAFSSSFIASRFNSGGSNKLSRSLLCSMTGICKAKIQEKKITVQKVMTTLPAAAEKPQVVVFFPQKELRIEWEKALLQEVKEGSIQIKKTVLLAWV